MTTDNGFVLSYGRPERRVQRLTWLGLSSLVLALICSPLISRLIIRGLFPRRSILFMLLGAPVLAMVFCIAAAVVIGRRQERRGAWRLAICGMFVSILSILLLGLLVAPIFLMAMGSSLKKETVSTRFAWVHERLKVQTPRNVEPVRGHVEGWMDGSTFMLVKMSRTEMAAYKQNLLKVDKKIWNVDDSDQSRSPTGLRPPRWWRVKDIADADLVRIRQQQGARGEYWFVISPSRGEVYLLIYGRG